MKCKEVNKLLVAYLDNEVTPSERALIQAHLAWCDTCQQELAALSALRSRIGQFLQLRAAHAAPSPQAWSHLQARLVRATYPTRFQHLMRTIQGFGQAFRPAVRMKQKFILAVIAALLIVTGTMVSTLPIRAKVAEALACWFQPDFFRGRFKIIMPSSYIDFTPLRPTYLPASLIYSYEESIRGNFRQVYAGKTWFVEIVQSRATADRSLPSGQRVSIGNQVGALNTGLQGKLKITTRFKFGVKEYTFTDGKLLTWYADELKIEMLSDLPLEEILRIAQSMVPGEVR